MARYLLIEFAEDSDADKLRRMIDEQTKSGKRYRVAGMFGRPKSFCECPRVEAYRQNLTARGARFGWNVCMVCKRPKKGLHPARNLIDIKDLMRMPGEPIAGVYEYRVDSTTIFEVPVKNIQEDSDGG